MTYELMDGQQIDLWKRIIDSEDLRKVIHDLVSAFKSKLSLIFESSRRVYSYWQGFAVVFPPGKVLDVLEITKGPGIEICAHDGGCLE